MNRSIFAAGAALLSVTVCTTARAQAIAGPVGPAPTTSSATAPVAAAPSLPAPRNVVPAGSIVELQIAEEVSTKFVKRGDNFAIRLLEDIKLNGETIIPAGAMGVGQVVDAGHSGMGGKPAKLVLAARYINYQGRQVPLRTLKYSATGRDNTTSAFIATAALGLPGMLVRGGDVNVPAGLSATAKLAEDLAPPANPTSGAPAPAHATNQVQNQQPQPGIMR